MDNSLNIGVAGEELYMEEAYAGERRSALPAHAHVAPP